MKTILSAAIGTFLLSVASAPAAIAMAEEVEVGDPQAGLEYAKAVCANCHGISNITSPVPEATAFDEIVSEPGMSAKALLVWMQTLHPTMPNITLEREDLMDVIAYILSHKDKD
jgi:mono/diheme cytochrome c family protein